MTDPSQDRISAIHEAGHAVAALLLNRSLVSVDIRRKAFGDGYSLGYTKAPIRQKHGDIEGAKRFIAQILAGPLAEGLLHDDFVDSGADANDRQQAYTVAAYAICRGKVEGKMARIDSEEYGAHQEEITALVGEGVELAASFVGAHSRAIKAVAEALLRRRALTAADVAAIVAVNPATVVA